MNVLVNYNFDETYYREYEGKIFTYQLKAIKATVTLHRVTGEPEQAIKLSFSRSGTETWVEYTLKSADEEIYTNKGLLKLRMIERLMAQ